MYWVKVPSPIRDLAVKKLAEKGIETRLSFPPIHSQPLFQERGGDDRESLPITDEIWAQKVDLRWPGLLEKQQDFVIQTLSESVDKLLRQGT